MKTPYARKDCEDTRPRSWTKPSSWPPQTFPSRAVRGNFNELIRHLIHAAYQEPRRFGLAAPGQSMADLPTVEAGDRAPDCPDAVDVGFALSFICEGEENEPDEIRKVLEALAGKVRQAVMQDAAACCWPEALRRRHDAIEVTTAPRPTPLDLTGFVSSDNTACNIAVHDGTASTTTNDRDGRPTPLAPRSHWIRVQ